MRNGDNRFLLAENQRLQDHIAELEQELETYKLFDDNGEPVPAADIADYVDGLRQPQVTDEQIEAAVWALSSDGYIENMRDEEVAEIADTIRAALGEAQ